MLKCFTGFTLHFLETLFRLLMLEQKEDKGDLEVEAWSAGLLTDTRGHCTIPEPSPAAPQPPEEGVLGQFKCFSKLFAVHAKFRRGQASAYRTMLCCNIGYVIPHYFGGKKKKNISSVHRMSPSLAAAMTLCARLARLCQVGSSRDPMQQREPKR